MYSLEDKERGKRLKDLRESFKYSQTELYVKLKEANNKTNGNITIDEDSGKNTVSQLERGRKLSLDYANAYADVFDVTLDYLYGRKEDWRPENADIKKQLGLTDKSINLLEDINKNSKELKDTLNMVLDSSNNPYFLNLLLALYEHLQLKNKIKRDALNKQATYFGIAQDMGFGTYVPSSVYVRLKNYELNKVSSASPEDIENASLYKINNIVKDMADIIFNNGDKQ